MYKLQIDVFDVFFNKIMKVVHTYQILCTGVGVNRCMPMIMDNGTLALRSLETSTVSFVCFMEVLYLLLLITVVN